ncbi:hypothetical protein BC939DRAFT_437781 [Gamsiella multidivaricata]|uniref:uncharacterized protein n=1 Tax=Gamsiella multidivaricata TaxID=101098 RepID=UPI00221FCA2F|nr:uncharacterized protein BC939DRAFT_437781 [Gamsiella multidivaricata]KAI7831162.1 hypothetical protein BC939DRAFT_437781 [Gamsiella multidivaricata]
MGRQVASTFLYISMSLSLDTAMSPGLHSRPIVRSASVEHSTIVHCSLRIYTTKARRASRDQWEAELKCFLTSMNWCFCTRSF